MKSRDDGFEPAIRAYDDAVAAHGLDEPYQRYDRDELLVRPTRQEVNVNPTSDKKRRFGPPLL